MRTYLLITLALIASVSLSSSQTLPRKPTRIGVVGLVHTHVHGIFRKAYKEPGQQDVEIVGIAEPDRTLAERYAKQYGFPMSLVYPTVEAMLDATKPEGVTDFGKIINHLQTVKMAAPRGIHVMVEKPLAVSLDHARQMAKLAEKHKIQLLTNYETTWYGSNHRAYRMVFDDKAIGDIRKMVIHDGHQGPKEIGVTPEFLSWLTDPVENGAGALFDFGCYGANLATWLMQGQRPTSVMAVTQQIKPDIYPNVDDEGTIIVTYPTAQAVIQASWNWPYSRKDLEIYGKTGSILALDKARMQVRLAEKEPTKLMEATQADAPATDPYAYFGRVVRGEEKVIDNLSSLPNNLVVMEILEAARTSAKTGKKVVISH
jgi:scyllo-inositol 2-dehydrogenase (NADP+)